MAQALAPAQLERILKRAQASSGIDFAVYRTSTMQRRVELRMAFCECPDAAAYSRRLDDDMAEMAALLDALLIKTTWMYRESQTFDLLRRRALTDLFAQRATEGAKMIRAWVPACSTGEEAYTLAMCLSEAQAMNEDLDFQVFATDIAERALAVAEAATYPETACAELPQDLRERYLSRAIENDKPHLRVADYLRGRVSIERHDALRSVRLAPKDAGVASFDIVCCRNLLVYLQPAAQEELFQRLLKTCSRGSLLVLGDSEALRAATTHDQLARIEGKIPGFRVL